MLRLRAAGVLYTTELVLANPSSAAATATLTYTPASALTPGAAVTASVALGPGRQLRIPDVLTYLAGLGAALPTGDAQGGTLLVDGVPALARTFCPNPNASVGGSFGVAYSAVPREKRARTAAWVYGLRQDSSVRSNLAIADARARDASVVAYVVELLDPARSSAVVKTLGPYPLAGGQWIQLSSVLSGTGVSSAWARVRPLQGSSDFVAYGVLNDGAAPGKGTSDGTWLPMAAE